MNPKIDRIVMSSDGHHATVSGPIKWEADDASATFAAAVGQMQGGDIVFAAGQNATVFTPANQRWETQVGTLNGNKLVVNDLADAWATAAVLQKAGSHECYPWKDDDLQVTVGDEVVSAGP